MGKTIQFNDVVVGDILSDSLQRVLCVERGPGSFIRLHCSYGNRVGLWDEWIEVESLDISKVFFDSIHELKKAGKHSLARELWDYATNECILEG